jgi:hypothetical protein
VYALALRQLARARSALSDEAGGRQACRDLSALWKSADADLALCREAVRECARLERQTPPAQ